MDADTLQSMADSGLSRAEIAALFGMSRSQINRYLADFAVTTSGNCKPQEVHGTGGQKANQLQSRAEFLVPVIQAAVEKEIHRATVLLRCARINPLATE